VTNDNACDSKIEYDLCATCAIKAERKLTALMASISTYTGLRQAVPSLTPSQESAVMAYVKATTGEDIE